MASRPFGGGRFLVDGSAYARSARPEVKEEWRQAVVNDQIAISSGFLIELLYSAVNAAHFNELHEEVTTGFQIVTFDSGTWELALDVQRELASHTPAFQRRFSPIDLLTAAAAHQHGLGVLHYDGDYDRIADHTGLELESRWIAPPGTLDDAPPSPRRLRLRAITTRLAQFPVERSIAVHDRVIAVLDGELRAAGLDLPEPVEDT